MQKTLSLITLLLGTTFTMQAFAADLATGGYSREFQQMGMMKMLDADATTWSPLPNLTSITVPCLMQSTAIMMANWTKPNG